MISLQIYIFVLTNISMHGNQKLLLRITCFFWLITKVTGYKTWIAQGRLYPVVPPFEFMDAVPAVVHSILFGLSLAGLVLLIAFPEKRFILISTLIIILCSCSLDVLRWQPWEYQFIFFLLIFIFNSKNPRALYSAITFVLASIYIYSGLHKINGGFLHSVWESMMLRQFFGLSRVTITHFKLHYIGLALPVIETAAGLGLLFMKKKIIPATLLIAMHIFILVLLLSVGVKFVSIVPQWNTAMILFLLLFYYRENFIFSFPSLLTGTNKIVFLTWGLLPALSFIGYWDNFLSSSLYAGNMKFNDICLGKTSTIPQLKPFFAKKDRRKICNGEASLKLYDWALKETGVLPYPEDWYFKKFRNKYEKMYPGTEATFIIYVYPYRDKLKLK